MMFYPSRIIIAFCVLVAVLGALFFAGAVFAGFPTPIETHRACYEESFGAGTVPTSIEIPCPDDKNTGEEVTK